MDVVADDVVRTRSRVVGVDVARGVAVLGMFTAHLGAYEESWRDPTNVLHAADGRSAAMFALLAGVSMGLMTGGPRPPAGARLWHAVVRVLTRCAVLWVVGAAMIALDTPVVVILPSYAVVLAVAVVALRWPPGVDLAVAVVAVVAGPFVLHAVRQMREGAATGLDADASWLAFQPVDIMVGEYYPGVVWIAYVLVGLAVARLDLSSRALPWWLVGVGATAAVVGYGAGAVLGRSTDDPTLTALLSIEPHADTTPELVGNTGAAVAVLGLCVLVGRRWPRLLAPLAATGALAFTAYCGHLVAIAVLGDGVVWNARNSTLVAFVVVTLAATWLWRTFLGRGPLERLLHEPSVRLADAVVPDGVPASRRS